MIWTREIDGVPRAGRLNVAHAIRDVARSVGEVREILLPPATGRNILGMGRALAAVALSILGGRPLPIQCAIYADRRTIDRALAQIDPDRGVIYLDGVRTYPLLKRLRARSPRARIVVDFDDLMSRRMALLRAAGQPLSPGYLASRLPPALVRLAMGPLGALVVRYEARALRRVEAEVVRLADDVVLLSSADLDDLPYGGGHARRHAIAPSAAIIRPAQSFGPGPIRFTFVGTDMLTQNRLTIDYLIGLWRRHAIAAPLVIYGTQARKPALPPHVSLAGYVPDIAEAYRDNSVLVSPAFLGGGIKTKVLEAFGHGAPVVANRLTFEAMPVGGYPLCCDGEAALVAILSDPEAHRADFDAAARIGQEYVRENHGIARFVGAWTALLLNPGER